VQEAFVVALERWPRDGTPANPAGWIVVTARNRAIDRLRRERRLAARQARLERLLPGQRPDERRARKLAAGEAQLERALPSEEPMSPIPDERLELMFACCHPALEIESRVALTLRALAGLSTPEIARLFLVPEAAMAQRLVRAKRKLRAAGIRFDLPRDADLPDRLGSVLATLYLVYTREYASARPGERSDEALRLARVLAALMPDEPEALGLLALMRLHDARRTTRTDPDGRLVLLSDQDRSRWDAAAIAEGLRLVERALALGGRGAYVLQAAIAAEHARARRPEDTDWRRIAAGYDRLAEVQPGPVVRLNRAVAVAMARGPQAGLALMDELAAELDAYHLLHAARADLLRRLDRHGEAAAAYRRALALATEPVDRAFLERRLGELET
jgi:RNA polymerase sigma-70 factor (ECF subfamily)